MVDEIGKVRDITTESKANHPRYRRPGAQFPQKDADNVIQPDKVQHASELLETNGSQAYQLNPPISLSDQA